MIYFDHNATTPLDERVLDAMAPYLSAFYGNPSSLYRMGRVCRGAVDTAREQVAALVGAHPSEIVFTSGGTEANNLALKGLAFSREPGLIAAGATEHPSVLEPLEFLKPRGWRVATIPVNRDGVADPSFVESLPVGDLRFVTLMMANNETGVIQDIAPIVGLLRERGVVFHCDAVQAAGKVPVDFKASGAHAMSLSGHKIYGPKGVGALILDKTVTIEPLLHGGGQEQGLRGGTENVAAIVGFGKAAELALSELAERQAHLLGLRKRLEAGLKAMPGATLFAEHVERLPNTVQFGVAGYDGEALVMSLDRQGFALSSGSACASGAGEPSPVLIAMGVDPVIAKSAIRASFGKGNTEAEADRFLEALKKVVRVPIPESRGATPAMPIV
ncbi:cysteine desulfurase family protein [Methylocaldum sp.]|uniref:cysteine desulfurase family protein n=1 Tax=Methylocaldum sp. TaxID=1969727 RepID=UPI002D6DE246|nr:cysteine desulfurase family protein [Methylocaldum sp.]HYE34084.1 cysteine desulfurase family protein [Methylocaldum sp.]